MYTFLKFDFDFVWKLYYEGAGVNGSLKKNQNGPFHIDLSSELIERCGPGSTIVD